MFSRRGTGWTCASNCTPLCQCGETTAITTGKYDGARGWLAAEPVSTWHYDFEPAEATPHIGPMVQDFKAAFYPGRDDRSITTHEFDGVALAAIQGLNQKLAESGRTLERRLEQKETEIAELQQQNADLLRRLEALEARLR